MAILVTALVLLAAEISCLYGHTALIGPRQNAKSSCPSVPNAEKFDCFPGEDATQDACEARGCCWDDLGQQSGVIGPYRPEQPSMRFPIHVGAPNCYYSADYPGYTYVNQTQTYYGFVAYLQRTVPSAFPEDVNVVRMDVYLETKSRLRVKLTDPRAERYEVPYPEMPTASYAVTNTDYEFKFDDKVGFSIIRRDTGEVLFDATVGSFIYADQYLQLSAKLPTSYLYGLGDHHDTFARSMDWQLIPLFTSELYPDYGSHPFYLSIEESSKTHGVFLFNSNGMDILLQPTPAITYRVIGGILDFYFFLGPNPGDVVAQYTEVIGRPNLPPYWSLGFQLCRYGYGSANTTRDTWLRNKNAGVPQDVQWNDIDYMDNYKDFTIDKQTYNNLPEVVQELHENDVRYIMMIDAGISVQPIGTYPSFDEGVAMDIFIKNYTGGFATGQVWPKVAVFPDFTHPNAYSYLKTQYKNYHDVVPFDGVWIDMNEPTTFTEGSIYGGCPNTTWDFPPYVPDVQSNKLYGYSICMSSKQYGGIHYNLHNLYGFLNGILTSRAIQDILHKRPFVISRSTAPGHGHYANHWSGDIYSSWSDLQQSIPNILNFNMYGIPMVGADICGFHDNTTLEMCQRWTELGAFYPFSRNHNDYNTIEQDPVGLGQEMVDVAVQVLTLRYTFLPFMYTQFFRATVDGQTVVRPLFFEFPEDQNTYTIQDQFIWGNQLMVLPVVNESVTVINPYIPKGVWYLYPGGNAISSKGEALELDAPIGNVPLALRGHSIIPTQQPSQTTTASRKNSFGLLVALDENGEAEGELFWDDGESIDTVENGAFSLISFNASKNSIASNVVQFNYPGEVPMVLGDVTVYGVSTTPTKVTVNGASHPFSYDSKTQVLSITKLTVQLKDDLAIDWE